MKLVTYELFQADGRAEKVGILHGEGQYVLDALAVAALYLTQTEEVGHPYQVARAYLGSTMLELIEGGKGALNLLKKALAHVAPLLEKDIALKGVKEDTLAFKLADIRLLAPLKPPSMRDGLNCYEHFKNLLKVKNLDTVPELFSKRPFYYRGNQFSISGPDSIVPWPSYGTRMDFELEIFAILGKAGESIPVSEAMDHVFGYTIFNDFTARNQQPEDSATTLGPSKCKCFTGGNAIGPCIVTADEIKDPGNLRMQARINGEKWSDNSTKEMLFNFAEMISYISQDEKLYPGECIASGTMSFGAGQEMGKFLEDGALVELEVEGLGILRNVIKRI